MIMHWALLAAVMVLVVCRRPELFSSPRFWAEEGAVYFEYAWHHGLLKALFTQHFSYYAVVPTLATAFATLLPLTSAPLATTLVSALFQVLVSAVVIFGHSPFWDSWPKKLLLAFGVQLFNPYEVWLTTIGTQYWMTIAVFLILLVEKGTTGRATRIFHRIMVIVGGLSGGQPVLLAPVYALKAWRSKSREEWLLTGCLIMGGIVQLSALLAAKVTGDPYLQTRFGGVAFDLIRTAKLHLVDPYLSESFFNLPSVIAMDNAFAGLFFRFLPNSLSYVSTLAALLLTAGALLTVLAVNRRSHIHQYLFCAWLLVTVFSTLLSLQMSSSPRYAFAPALMLLTLFIGEMRAETRSRPARMFSTLFLAMAFLSALHDIRAPSRIYFQPGLPVWRNEVSFWQQNPSYKPMIWPPYMNRRWNIDLQQMDPA